MDKPIVSYDMPRRKALALGTLVGVGLGFANLALGVEFFTVEDYVRMQAGGFFNQVLPYLILAGKLVIAVVVTAVLHEGVHGAVAKAFGHNPRFGFKPPLVYVTFDSKVPRGAFILVALAPLVVLDIAFGALVLGGVFPVVAYMCLSVNTIGAVGDVWITLKLIPQPRGSMVQDTKTGIEVWAAE